MSNHMTDMDAMVSTDKDGEVAEEMEREDLCSRIMAWSTLIDEHLKNALVEKTLKYKPKNFMDLANSLLDTNLDLIRELHKEFELVIPEDAKRRAIMHSASHQVEEDNHTLHNYEPQFDDIEFENTKIILEIAPEELSNDVEYSLWRKYYRKKGEAEDSEAEIIKLLRYDAETIAKIFSLSDEETEPLVVARIKGKLIGKAIIPLVEGIWIHGDNTPLPKGSYLWANNPFLIINKDREDPKLCIVHTCTLERSQDTMKEISCHSEPLDTTATPINANTNREKTSPTDILHDDLMGTSYWSVTNDDCLDYLESPESGLRTNELSHRASVQPYVTQEQLHQSESHLAGANARKRNLDTNKDDDVDSSHIPTPQFDRKPTHNNYDPIQTPKRRQLSRTRNTEESNHPVIGENSPEQAVINEVQPEHTNSLRTNCSPHVCSGVSSIPNILTNHCWKCIELFIEYRINRNIPLGKLDTYLLTATLDIGSWISWGNFKAQYLPNWLANWCYSNTYSRKAIVIESTGKQSKISGSHFFIITGSWFITEDRSSIKTSQRTWFHAPQLSATACKGVRCLGIIVNPSLPLKAFEHPLPPSTQCSSNSKKLTHNTVISELDKDCPEYDEDGYVTEMFESDTYVNSTDFHADVDSDSSISENEDEDVDTSKNSVLIMFANTRGFVGKEEEILEAMDTAEGDVMICLEAKTKSSTTYVRNDKLITIVGGDKAEGSVIITRLDDNCRPDPVNGSIHVDIGDETATIIPIYIENENKVVTIKQHLEALSQFKFPCIAVGDWNINLRQKSWQKRITAKGLTLLDHGLAYTWRSPDNRHKSSIDYAITNIRGLTLTTSPVQISSDHVTLCIRIENASFSRAINAKIINDKPNQESIAKFIHEHGTWSLTYTPINLLPLTDWVHETMKIAALTLGPGVGGNNSWKDGIRKADSVNAPRVIHSNQRSIRKVKKSTFKLPQETFLRETNTPEKGETMVKAIRDELEKIQRRKASPGTDTSFPTLRQWYITLDEIVAAIRKRKNKSAPGQSGLSARIIKYMNEDSISTLLKTINKSLSLPYIEPFLLIAKVFPVVKTLPVRRFKDLRPLVVEEELIRLVMTIISKRLRPSVSEYQVAYQVDRGAWEIIACVSSKYQMATTNRKRFILYRRDQSNAFGTMDNLDISNTLASRADLEDRVADWVQKFFRMGTLCVTSNDAQSSGLRFETGVFQGDPMGQISFIFWDAAEMDKAMLPRYPSLSIPENSPSNLILQYSDDLAIWAEGDNCTTEAATMICLLDNAAPGRGTQYNPIKEEYHHIVWEGDKPRTKKIGRKPIGGAKYCRPLMHPMRLLGAFVSPFMAKYHWRNKAVSTVSLWRLAITNTHNCHEWIISYREQVMSAMVAVTSLIPPDHSLRKKIDAPARKQWRRLLQFHSRAPNSEIDEILQGCFGISLPWRTCWNAAAVMYVNACNRSYGPAKDIVSGTCPNIELFASVEGWSFTKAGSYFNTRDPLNGLHIESDDIIRISTDASGELGAMTIACCLLITNSKECKLQSASMRIPNLPSIYHAELSAINWAYRIAKTIEEAGGLVLYIISDCESAIHSWKVAKGGDTISKALSKHEDSDIQLDWVRSHQLEKTHPIPNNVEWQQIIEHQSEEVVRALLNHAADRMASLSCQDELIVCPPGLENTYIFARPSEANYEIPTRANLNPMMKSIIKELINHGFANLCGMAILAPRGGWTRTCCKGNLNWFRCECRKAKLNSCLAENGLFIREGRVQIKGDWYTLDRDLSWCGWIPKENRLHIPWCRAISCFLQNE